MPFIYITPKVFEDSLTCGCDKSDSVRYHLRANKVDLSLLIFPRPPKGAKFKNRIRTLAAVAPAEAGSIDSTVSVVWKEVTV
jgi:hypothetical protein